MSRRSSCGRLNAILARNRLLRSARADRGETAFFAVKPGAGAELVGYEDSRTRFLGEGSLAKPTGCERWRWRKLDDEGKLWTFDPAASFTVDMTLARRRRRPRPSSSWAAPTTPSGRPNSSPAGSTCRPMPEPDLQTRDLRDPRRRAVARPADALAVRLFRGRQAARPDPSHAAPVGACDGERTRHVDHDLERRRGLLRLRQRPAERPDRLPLRQRDRAAAGPDPLRPRPRRRGNRLAGICAVPARGRDARGVLRAGRGDFSKSAAAASRWKPWSSSRPTGRATSAS